ncbi:MAG: hypothetical protein LBS01_03785 [Prevotellaceae bacterium]|jgi:uncharacterized protein (TIGR00661 family)|nr:hypothetical protein [Prevotellaceae bacterium]
MKILVCPLDWGLGHATRCAPLIRNFIDSGDEVVVAADGLALQFLRGEFQQVQFETLRSYGITYSKGKSQVGAMLRNLPKIIWGVCAEHRWLCNYLRHNKIDTVVSDNRFGLWSPQVKCIYITHQLMVKMPEKIACVEKFVWRVHRWFINRYDKCWIPDFEDAENNLSGDLSHKYPLPARAEFINPLSRFSGKTIAPNAHFHTVCVLSGVEPQRSLFENDLLKKFENSTEKILIIQGNPQEKILKYQKSNITVLSHIDSETLAGYLIGAQQIICRSGYSSIMDLSALNCMDKATLIPTPGQTEQEYLAKYHQKNRQNCHC